MGITLWLVNRVGLVCLDNGIGWFIWVSCCMNGCLESTYTSVWFGVAPSRPVNTIYPLFELSNSLESVPSFIYHRLLVLFLILSLSKNSQNSSFITSLRNGWERFEKCKTNGLRNTGLWIVTPYIPSKTPPKEYSTAI